MEELEKCLAAHGLFIIEAWFLDKVSTLLFNAPSSVRRLLLPSGEESTVKPASWASKLPVHLGHACQVRRGGNHLSFIPFQGAKSQGSCPHGKATPCAYPLQRGVAIVADSGVGHKTQETSPYPHRAQARPV